MRDDSSISPVAADSLSIPPESTEKPAAGRIAVELCAGLGGMGMGLRSLGFHVAKAYDSWSEAVAVYNHNHGASIASECNLRTARGRKKIVEDCQSLGEIDLLAAGPPCKGFSRLQNGRHDGRNGHNRVLATIPDYVGALRPRMVLIENVPDLIRHGKGRTLRRLLDRLQSPAPGMRYSVVYGVFDAAVYGTPQSRRRLFVWCVREGAGMAVLPEPGPDLVPMYSAIRHRRSVPPALGSFYSTLLDAESLRLTSASQALSDLPELGPGEPEVFRPYASKPKTAFQRWVRQDAPAMLSNTQTPAVNQRTLARLEHISPGGCARSIPEEYLDGLARRYDSAYRRLHPDAPSTALSTKYDCVYHYGTNRSLSVREYARLQGLPDRLSFPTELVCRREAYEMIGNSVPPLLVEGVLGQALALTKTDTSAG
jgi:DNA (cytosine-5)-methyltransferase 1